MSNIFNSERDKAEILYKSIKEAERFIEKAKSAKRRFERIIDGGEGTYGPSGTKEFAAAKRAALDLKSQLTDLNKSTY